MSEQETYSSKVPIEKNIKSVGAEVSTEALHLAAQCWCDEETSNIEMDECLAMAFAKRLDRLARQLAERDANVKDCQAKLDKAMGALKQLDCDGCSIPESIFNECQQAIAEIEGNK